MAQKAIREEFGVGSMLTVNRGGHQGITKRPSENRYQIDEITGTQIKETELQRQTREREAQEIQAEREKIEARARAAETSLYNRSAPRGASQKPFNNGPLGDVEGRM